MTSLAAKVQPFDRLVSTESYTVAVVDDHVLVRELLVRLIRERDDVGLVSGYSSTDALLRAAVVPDLVLLDLELTGHPAADVATLIARGAQVMVVSATASATQVRTMIRAGASGFVTKRDSLEALFEGVTAVLRGRGWMTTELAAVLAANAGPDRPELSQQEARALVLYASGLKLDSVARRMGVQPGTAKQYIDRVRDKYAALGRSVRTKTELYAAAIADGLLEAPER